MIKTALWLSRSRMCTHDNETHNRDLCGVKSPRLRRTGTPVLKMAVDPVRG